MAKIEICKYWDEYTEEERKQLPPLESKTKKNWLWDGENWDFVPRD